MDYLATLMVAQPTGFWATLITFFEGIFNSYVLGIILLTIIIKLVLSPLDFMNKKVARDNARMQAVIQPKVAEIQKKYGHDRNLVNQKTAELYKSQGFSMGGSCFVMLIYMVLTILVFFTLFSTLMGSAPYRVEQQYLELRQTYTQAINDGNMVEEAQTLVLEKYDDRDSKFLWIQNVWFADNPWTPAVLTFDQYLNNVGDKVVREMGGDATSLKELKTQSQTEYDAFIADFRAEYDEVMTVVINERGGVNGYLITAVLAIGTAFLSQYLMQRRNVAKAQKANKANGDKVTAGTNKIMLIILPLVMGLFTLFYNAVFGMYIIAGQLVSMLLFPIFDIFLDKLDDKKRKKEEEKIKVEYSRK